jgi:WD40 repeat protein
LGDYELLEEIARGGMGIVYRARQVSLNRPVAVKVLLGGQFANETFIKRFRREAEALASLNHPNIVAIYEVGEHESHSYFSMELIEGRSLAEAIRDEPLPPRQAAQLIESVAQAVAFAHGRRLLHRDLKPSNVLLDPLGVPHITDFGLAKRSDEDTDLTMTGQILGSPNYMAPEQADPTLAPTTAASDVYSLGAMLYHLLTGRPPFLAETVTQTLRLVGEGNPVAPSLLHTGVSRDLETICLKCLETNPRLRYSSAHELAEELGCFLRDEPIRARPVSRVVKVARWCRRKPALASSLGVVAALLLFVAVGSPIALFRIQGEREQSEAARKHEAALRLRAQAAEREGRRQLYTALLEQAHASVRSGEVGQRLGTLEAIRRAAVISNSPALRGETLAALRLLDLRLEREWPTGPRFTLERMDPTFESVALCRGEGPVEIRGASDWRVRATLPASTNLPAYLGEWSVDGRYLAVKRDYSSGGERADLEIWDIANRQRVLVVHDFVNSAMSFHPLQHRLITAQRSGGLITWDLENGQEVARLPWAGLLIRLEFSPDGERFAAVERSAGRFTVSVHDSTTGATEASHTFADSVMGLDWHPSGRWVAIGDYGGMVHLMDSRTGQTRALGSHKAQTATVAFSPEGCYLFSGGWEGELICWDMRTMERALTIGRQGWTVQFQSDGQKCAVLTPSGIQLHALVRPNHREFSEDLGRRLRRAAFSPDGRWLAASADQYLGVWDLTRTGPAALVREADEVRPIFADDGKELFISGQGARCPRWRLIPGTNAAALPVLLPGPISTQEKFSSVSVASNVVVYTGPQGSVLASLEDHTATEPLRSRTIDGVNGISPDGRWLGIYRPFSPLLYIYRLPEMDRVATLRSRANIGDFVFSPAGDQIAVSTRRGVEFWATNTWTRTRVLTNFTGILFSPDASTFWLTSDFRTAGLYDARTLDLLLPLPTGTLPLALSKDGRRLAVSVDLRRLQVWDLEDVRHELRDLGLDWPARLAQARGRER